MNIFLALIFQFILFGTLVAQQSIKPFPQKVDLDDYIDCKCLFDTLEIKNSIVNKDFGGEKLSYDYSRNELVDINNDGNCEVLHLFSSGVRGWPHDFMTIYKVEANTAIKIFDGSSNFASFAEPDGDYLQINYIGFDGHKTNPIYKNTVWKFNGQEYKPYYSPDLTKGEMKSKGLELYRDSNYKEAIIYFKNVLIIPHSSNNQLLASANDVAITLIKLKRFKDVKDFLLPYMSNANDKKTLASSHYNIGLSKEKDNDLNEAKKHFKKSYEYNPTNAAKEKLGKYER